MKQGVCTWLVVTSLVGCGGRSLGGDSGADGSENTHTGGASHTSMSGPDGSADDLDSGPSSGDEAGDEPIDPPNCDEPKVACGEVCVDLRSSWEHCGECFHSCRFEGGAGGRCHLGECQPTYSHCILPSDAFSSCVEVCASLGEACASTIEEQTKGCSVNYEARFNNAEGADCNTTHGSGRFNHDPCDTPFDWTQTAAGGSQIPMVGLRCCCTKS
jgi:hypothetical protein